MVNIELAGIPVAIDNRYPDMERFCAGYETEKSPEMVFRATSEEIEEERLSQTYEFSAGYLETVCVYRKLALAMLQRDVFIMHASVIEVDGACYAFLAHSGTGKTTQTRLWLEYFGSRARVVNGDKPLVRMKEDGSFWAYGTPWCGKEGLGCNASVPLKALFLVERATEPECSLASEEECVDRLFHQLLMPEEAGQMEKLLTLTDALVQTIPAYILRCNMEVESVITAWEAVST